MPSPCPCCRVGSVGSPVRWAPPLWPRGNILEGRPLHPGQRVGSAGSLPAAHTVLTDRAGRRSSVRPKVLTVLEMALLQLPARAGGGSGRPPMSQDRAAPGRAGSRGCTPTSGAALLPAGSMHGGFGC